MVTIEIEGKQYNLELKARMIETLELSLKSKKSLFDIFMPVDVKVKTAKKGEVDTGGFKYCSIGDMLRIFWAELQVNNTAAHTITYDEACDLFDKYMKTEQGQKETLVGFYLLLGKGANFFPVEEDATAQ